MPTLGIRQASDLMTLHYSASIVDMLRATGDLSDAGLADRLETVDPASLPVESLPRDRINVRDFGTVGNGSSDDQPAIQAAIDAAISVGQNSVVYFPNPLNSYGIARPIDYTDRVRFVGQSAKNTEIRALPGFDGFFLLRDWTDADSATAEIPGAPVSRVHYKHIRDLAFNTWQNTGLTAIGIANIQEESVIRNVILRSYQSTDSIGIHIDGAIQGGIIDNVAAFGDGWKQELRVVSAGNTSLHISTWVTAPSAHTDSLFYLENTRDVTLNRIHVEGWVDDPDKAIFYCANQRQTTIRDCYVGFTNDAACTLLTATDESLGSPRFSPILENIAFNNSPRWVGPYLIADTANVEQERLIANDPAITGVVYYDNRTFRWWNLGNPPEVPGNNVPVVKETVF